MNALFRSQYMSPRYLVPAAAVLGAFALGLLASALLDRLSAGRDVTLPGSRLDMTATAYCKGTTTASGLPVRRGVAAADPTVLPTGSVVGLTTGVSEFDGVYTVLDTGPLVKGPSLDLYVWSCDEALSFGRRTVEATVLRLGWDPRASAESLVNRLFRRMTRRRVPRAEPEAPSAEGTARPAPEANTSEPPSDPVVAPPSTSVPDSPPAVDAPGQP